MQAYLIKLKYPSSGRDGENLISLFGRECALEIASGGRCVQRIRFTGIEAYKVSYMYTEFLPEEVDAYDRLVDLGKTDWLVAVARSLQERAIDTSELRHLAIELDDGPTYEVLCRGYCAEPESTPKT